MALPPPQPQLWPLPHQCGSPGLTSFTDPSEGAEAAHAHGASCLWLTKPHSIPGNRVRGLRAPGAGARFPNLYVDGRQWPMTLPKQIVQIYRYFRRVKNLLDDIGASSVAWTDRFECQSRSYIPRDRTTQISFCISTSSVWCSDSRLTRRNLSPSDFPLLPSHPRTLFLTHEMCLPMNSPLRAFMGKRILMLS